jgi:undecaprenyl phosphate N,N'-diacetylbacillosamine 1-phosphate transferase
VEIKMVKNSRKINLLLKRMIDFFGSLIGVIIISPILIIIALAIKLTSKGTVLFKQERLGRNGKVFKIVKFRTMVVNAENIGDGLRVSNENDVRITKVGKLLRATSFDELPQLWNVIVGDMSLVGPRPPVTYHPYNGYDNYPEWAKPRFNMRPGITGLAQVAVRNSVVWDKRIVVDVEYIEKFSLRLDIMILFKTVVKVIKRERIYGQMDKKRAKQDLKT